MDLATVGGVILLILIIVLLLILIALPMYLTARWLDEDEGLLKALGTTFLLVIVLIACLLLIPIPLLNLIVAIILNLLVIKVVYEVNWSKAFIMWIVAIIVGIILLIVLDLLIGVGLILLS